LSFRLSGRVASGTPAQAVDPTGAIVGGATLALVLAGAGWWYYSRRQEVGPARDEPQDEREQLLDRIAVLDDDYEAGRVGEADYRRRRAALKAKLIEAWDREAGEG
jgi:hypothetical protein